MKQFSHTISVWKKKKKDQHIYHHFPWMIWINVRNNLYNSFGFDFSVSLRKLNCDYFQDNWLFFPNRFVQWSACNKKKDSNNFVLNELILYNFSRTIKNEREDGKKITQSMREKMRKINERNAQSKQKWRNRMRNVPLHC